MKYSTTDSAFIRGKIRKTAFQDRAYIDDLLQLAHWIQNPPGGCFSNQAYDLLCRKYPEEYVELVREIRGEAAAITELLRMEEAALARAKALRELQQAEEESLHQEQEDWSAAGGIAPEKP